MPSGHSAIVVWESLLPKSPGRPRPGTGFAIRRRCGGFWSGWRASGQHLETRLQELPESGVARVVVAVGDPARGVVRPEPELPVLALGVERPACAMAGARVLRFPGFRRAIDESEPH